MIETLIKDYLTKKLDVGVYLFKPSKKPTSFVLIEKTGGGERDRGLYDATIAIQSYTSDFYKTVKLNEKVKMAMQDIVELDEICRCKLNSDYNFTDTSTNQYRYQAVYDIVHY